METIFNKKLLATITLFNDEISYTLNNIEEKEIKVMLIKNIVQIMDELRSKGLDENFDIRYSHHDGFSFVSLYQDYVKY